MNSAKSEILKLAVGKPTQFHLLNKEESFLKGREWSLNAGFILLSNFCVQGILLVFS